MELTIGNYQSLVSQFEREASLLGHERVRERFELLDRLNLLLEGGLAPTSNDRAANTEMRQRLLAVRTRLEAANESLCRRIRAEILKGNCPALFAQWLQSDCDPPGGLRFDFMDEIVSGVLALAEPDPPPEHPPDGMVFYQPTPARHIFHLLRLVTLSETDVLIDLGSGLGHVAMLASICTGADTIGIEREAAYVASARNCALQLNLDRVLFVEQDAREANLSLGTVFFLYTPFSGRILGAVLERLQSESTRRPIRVCTLGPCTETVAREPWLECIGKPDPGRIAIFASRACRTL